MGPTGSTQPKPRSSGMDFLQAASNAIAGNVAGPVDLIGAGLRGVGLPIPQNPVGGSQWMAEKGLTKDVPMGPARIAGETFGMAGPAVAAANTSKIAQALNQARDNVAAPRTLNPQTGAIVWHGSPHKFDRFDSSKIGTGEGAQAYGHGLYLAESPDVARSYATGNQGRAAAADGLIDSLPAPVQMDVFKVMNMRDGFVKDAMRDDLVSKYPEVAGVFEAKNAALYKVDLPDEQIARMLDWDKPLSQQAPGVQKAAKKAGIKAGRQKMYVPLSQDEYSALLQQRYGVKQITDLPQDKWFEAQNLALRDQVTDYNPLGREVFESIAGGDANFSEEAAKRLRALGVPGIRYLDGGSRTAGNGTSNYVIFPQEEGMLTILERNGQPLLFGR